MIATVRIVPAATILRASPAGVKPNPPRNDTDAADALSRAAAASGPAARQDAAEALRELAKADPQLARVCELDAERVETLYGFQLADLAHDYLALSLSDRARSDAECRALGLD